MMIELSDEKKCRFRVRDFRPGVYVWVEAVVIAETKVGGSGFQIRRDPVTGRTSDRLLQSTAHSGPFRDDMFGTTNAVSHG